MPSIPEALILFIGGAVAGFINTLAGGGSFLTVPLLVFMGLPATVANATNRLAVFTQNLAAVAGFRQEGYSGLRPAMRVLPPTLVGAGLGAWAAAVIPERPFEIAFALIMLGMLPVIVRNPKPSAHAVKPSRVGEAAIYFLVGLYGGAFQAGLGIPLIFALVLVGGFDLVRANSIKVVLIAALTAVSLGLFIWHGKVVFGHGAVLAAGSALGGYVGGRAGAKGGERLIRPILVVMVVVFAARLLMRALELGAAN